jgi:hypothetical protein
MQSLLPKSWPSASLKGLEAIRAFSSLSGLTWATVQPDELSGRKPGAVQNLGKLKGVCLFAMCQGLLSTFARIASQSMADGRMRRSEGSFPIH